MLESHSRRRAGPSGFEGIENFPQCGIHNGYMKRCSPPELVCAAASTARRWFSSASLRIPTTTVSCFLLEEVNSSLVACLVSSSFVLLPASSLARRSVFASLIDSTRSLPPSLAGRTNREAKIKKTQIYGRDLDRFSVDASASIASKKQQLTQGSSSRFCAKDGICTRRLQTRIGC